MYKTLDRNEPFQGSAVPEWATAAAHFMGYWYFEESLEQTDGARFQRVGSGYVSKYGDGAIKGYSKAVLFTPRIEQDDPLPPAPESVAYYEGTPGGAHLLVEGGWSGLVRIQAKRPGGVTGVVLDADAALQLAHDLNRMANEIKRRERAQSGE